MGVLLKNNAVSHLATSITTGTISLAVTAGQGPLFPAPTGSDWFPITVVKASGVLEIMRCTSRTGDVLTVVRAQEGTAAQAFTAGDRVELRLTAAVVADVIAQITALSTAALLDANNLSDLASVPTARTNLGLGTAATANVTTSNTDTTAGRVLKPGDFGLGVVGGGPDITNLNTTFASGFYKFGSAATGNPVPASGGSLLVTSLGGNFIQQISITLDAGTKPVINVRHYDVSGNPGGWVLLYHSVNLTAAQLAVIFGYTPVQKGTGVGQTSNLVKIGWDGVSSLRATVDSSDLGKLWTEAVFKRPDAGWVLVGNGTTLPAGGSWAYFYTTFNGSGAALSGAVGIVAGGTVLPATNNIGFAWRWF